MSELVMPGATAIFTSAGEREDGCLCPRCGQATPRGQAVAVCADCGTVHHRHCWEDKNSCGSYGCAPERVAVVPGGVPVLTITSTEIEDVVPLPSRRPYAPSPTLDSKPSVRPARSSLALASFLTALAGVVFFGPLTGLVATVMGSIALGSLRSNGKRGTGLAVAGVLLGLVDVVGWIVALSIIFSRPGPELSLEQFQNDPAALENLDPVLNRAMRATVLIRSDQGRGLLQGAVFGSGVILKLTEQEAVIVTNRHVIDAGFTGSEVGEAGDASLPGVTVRFIGQEDTPGRVIWRAPDGIDLALLRVAVHATDMRAALWEPDRGFRVGDQVFAIGNPHRLGWTHTQGAISQMRRRRAGDHDVRVIQTQTAINPGNSGGGLFDREGYLLGINTWTEDKRVSEGLSFAIALDTLLRLHPPALDGGNAASAAVKP